MYGQELEWAISLLFARRLANNRITGRKRKKKCAAMVLWMKNVLIIQGK